MTVKRIFKYPSNEIKTKCENFDISSDDFTIFKDLYDTMNYYNQNDIISFITANQIGYNKNIAIITGKLDDPSYWFIVNPVISNYSNHTTSQKEFSIEFTPGLLLLFPSYLHHSVPLNKTDKTRCSLAFNIVPTIGLGEETSLTELKFQ